MSGQPEKGSIYELFMLALCIYVLVAMSASALLTLDESTVAILNHVDTAVCLVFLFDFGLKLYSAESKVGYLKWGWIDLISSIPMLGPLRWGGWPALCAFFGSSGDSGQPSQSSSLHFAGELNLHLEQLH